MADARYISDRVKKQLYALSGNECANPLCNKKLVFPDDNAKDEQICHIEAASPDGPRYNPNQTEEERRSFDNLILLCHRCHDMIDHNPAKYTVEVLKKWKREHEAKYQNNNKAKTFSFSVPDGLLARDKEADNLFDKIINNRIFNLVGIGGSGKSSLAYLMMQKHESDFNEIANVVVNNNIKNDFVEQINKTLNLEFERNEDAFSEIIANLQNNFKSGLPNLLVLDINETSDKTRNDEIINIIIKNKDILKGWKILILSREKVDTRNRIETHNLNDNEDVEFLKELFLQKAGERYNNFGDFAELFKIVFYNPLLTEQLGLYLNNEPELATIDNIKNILYGESFKEEDMQGMSADRHDETIVSFLTNLIKYNDFNDNEKNLLLHFVLWQAEYIGYEVIKDLLKGVFLSDDDLKNTLKSLSKRAILDTNNEQTLGYKLHGLLAASLRQQIDIENEDYDIYLDNIKRIIEYSYNNFVPYADCIGNSLCEYNIITNYVLIGNVANKYQKVWRASYSEILLNKAIEFILKKISFDQVNTEYQNNLAGLYNNLAYLQYTQLEDYKSSELNFKKAIAIQENLSNDNPQYLSDLIKLYNNLAHLQKDYLGEYLSSSVTFEKAIKIGEQIPNDNNIYRSDLANAYNGLASLQYEKLGEYELAKSNYEKAIAIFKKLPNDNPEFQNDMAIAYTNIARFQQTQGDYASAELNYKKSIKIGEFLPKDDPEFQYDLFKSYNNFASLQNYHLGEYESAESNYLKAIHICKQLPTYNPQYQQSLAKTYMSLAMMQTNILKDYQSAELNYTMAIEIYKLLSKNNSEYQNQLATTYWCLAYLQSEYLEEYKMAEKNNQNAIGIYIQIPNDIPEYLDSLSTAYYTLANLKVKFGEYQLAEKNYQKAIEIGNKLPKDNPVYQNNIAIYYNNLAQLQSNHFEDYDFALSNLQKVIEIREQLPKDDNKYQYYLADAYRNLALLQQLHFEDYKSTEAYYLKAIKIFKYLSSENPNYQNDLASTFNMFAQYYKNSKEFIKAIAMANKAINITDKLLVSDKNHKYLIYWIRRKHTLAEIYFDANEIECAKSILSEIKPQTEKCLVNTPNDKYTQTVNDEIKELLKKISTLES